MIRMRCVVLLLIGVVPSTLAAAHSLQVPQALHGGQAEAIGPYHAELVVSDGEVALYLNDRDNVAVSASAIKAKALVWTQESSIELPLVPEKRNRLQARADFAVAAVRRVVLTIDQEDQKPLQAWFVFGARRKP